MSKGRSDGDNEIPGVDGNPGENGKGCLTAPLLVTGGHILIHIGKSFGILYCWVYMKKFNDDWWITSVPDIRLQNVEDLVNP